MLKLILQFCFLSLILTSNLSHSQVKWDVPIEELGDLVKKKYIIDLDIGDTALIETDSIFCKNEHGFLALDGLTQTGSGDLIIKVLEGKKVSIKASAATDFLNYLVWYEAVADCAWLTSHQGKFIFVVDNINNKKSIRALAQ